MLGSVGRAPPELYGALDNESRGASGNIKGEASSLLLRVINESGVLEILGENVGDVRAFGDNVVGLGVGLLISSISADCEVGETGSSSVFP